VRAVLIGDEVTATGFGLAGLRTVVPEAGEVYEAYQRAARDHQLIIMTAEAAAELDEQRLDDYLSATRPMLLVIPDLRGRVRQEDFARQIRARLGMRQEDDVDEEGA
jgi:vacuolar-type H+-ATPase subunit F/Vma7